MENNDKKTQIYNYFKDKFNIKFEEYSALKARMVVDGLNKKLDEQLLIEKERNKRLTEEIYTERNRIMELTQEVYG